MSGDDKIASETWPISKLLTWTTDFLRRRGSESPRLDAEVMLAHVLDWQRVHLYTHYDEEVGEAARTAFRSLVRRRAEGSPVA
ncbi:MAG TPA: peptide chain release factor N(5)-glutamine methyltransferase, partial [Isosphaeraceae bacterium]|nr:peptide chain release factor N(5)-glutamine methyltransferase [Isosphaeraceae bacterium]